MTRHYGEDVLIEWLRRQPATEPIGDDAAFLPSDGDSVVTTDTQIAGVHVPPDLDPAHIARRLLSVNISDVAAMGATPTYAFLVIAAPTHFDHRRFLYAFTRAAERADVVLAGGDLATSPHLVTALTLHGRIETGHRCMARSGARPGHRVWVGGTVGESRIGLEVLQNGGRVTRRGVILPPPLRSPRSTARSARRAVRRHLLPTPQVTLGRWLASQTSEGGAIDLSDGLARDLGRMCRASAVGARIERASLPLDETTSKLATLLGIDPYQAALYGGEDYVLCFTLPADIEPPSHFGCRSIGEICHRPGLAIRVPNGRFRALEEKGWDHLNVNERSP